MTETKKSIKERQEEEREDMVSEIENLYEELTDPINEYYERYGDLYEDINGHFSFNVCNI